MDLHIGTLSKHIPTCIDEITMKVSQIPITGSVGLSPVLLRNFEKITKLEDPLISEEGQEERQEVLEHDQARKGLYRDISCKVVSVVMIIQRITHTVCVDNVQATRHGPDHHAHDLESKEEHWPHPMVLVEVAAGYAKPIQPSAAED